MNNNVYAVGQHNSSVIGRNGAHPNSPLGDPNGWCYGEGRYTYKMPGASRSFEFGDFAEETARFYLKWLMVVIMVGGVFLMFGNSLMITAMFKVMMWSMFVVVPYLFVKTKNRFHIYELN